MNILSTIEKAYRDACEPGSTTMAKLIFETKDACKKHRWRHNKMAAVVDPTLTGVFYTCLDCKSSMLSSKPLKKKSRNPAGAHEDGSP